MGPDRAAPAGSAYRFDKQCRLPDESAFARVFAKANRSRDNLFTVLSRENGKDVARLGLAISKKHCRHASGRNRLKRLVRESFRHHKADLAGLDLVVLGQPGASRADNRAVLASLAGHWQKTRSAYRGAPANEGRQVEKRHGNESGAGNPD